VTTAKAQRGIGSRYGTSREHPFDRWFRYPAGFSPEALKLAADAVGARRGAIVVEPFLGSAATASGLPGRNVVGIEAHPLIADLAATKLAAPPGPGEALLEAAQRLVHTANGQRGEATSEHPLVQRCFEPKVLESLARLRDAIAARPRDHWRRHLRWALLATLRDVASVKVGWPYQRPALERDAPYRDPASRFLARAGMIAEDLELAPGERPSGRVVRGDARSASSWRRAVEVGAFDACITSPPYLNNFDYADATRLELYFLGTVSSWTEMCRHVRADMVIATTQQSARRRARLASARLRTYVGVASEIEALTKKLASERARRPRGKEYDQVLPAYFADITRVLGHLHHHMPPGARAAWMVGDSAPYGVYVDTPRIIGRLASVIGFETEDDITVRSRGLRWRKNGSRHQVPLSERLITFRRT
jgi:hypothetical protein